MTDDLARAMELGPCPFCGSLTGRIDQFSGNMDEWRVCCENQSCQAWGPETKTQSEAYAAWNARAAHQPQGAGYSDEEAREAVRLLRDEAYGRVDTNDHRRKISRAAAIAYRALATLPATPSQDDHQWSHDVLHDLVMLRAEEWALSGGGPGIKERWEKAWRAAEEVFEP